METKDCKSLADMEAVSKPFHTCNGFTEVSFEDALKNYEDFTHAAHGMIYTKLDGKLWDQYPKNATALMQVRFDGMFGFPGGLVDPGEQCIHAALNRECQEEIALDLTTLSFGSDHHVVSHVNEDTKLVTHFYAQEVTEQTYCKIEMFALKAQEWGVESHGLVRIPLFMLGDGYRGFPIFLSQKFAGNAKEQLILTIKKRKIIEQSLLEKLLQASFSYELDTKKN